jgi:microcystin-dependent protein
MTSDLAMGGNKVTGMADGVDPTDGATVGQLSVSTGAPVGAVMDYAGATLPAGWLSCAGQSINRADYPDLFTAIGTVYGSASGSTFNLPDCRGRVTAGVDSNVGGLASRLTTGMSPNGTSLGATGGAQSVALTTAQLAAHTHTGSTASAGAHTHDVPAGGVENVRTAGADGLAASNSGGTSSSAGTHTHTMNLDNTGNGEAHANVQPTILFNKIIKALANG